MEMLVIEIELQTLLKDGEVYENTEMSQNFLNQGLHKPCFPHPPCPHHRISMVSSASAESLQEVSRLTERTHLLEKEVTELTKELERAIDQNTRMCQTVIQLESSRDKLKAKLRSFKQDTG